MNKFPVPTDGCTSLLGLYRRPFLCHVICFADSAVMKRRWILGMKGRYLMIFAPICVFLFCPSPESTSMNLEDLHFGQYSSSAWSPLNKMHPLGQACICSYGIFSARKVYVPHTCCVADCDHPEVGCQKLPTYYQSPLD